MTPGTAERARGRPHLRSARRCFPPPPPETAVLDPAEPPPGEGHGPSATEILPPRGERLPDAEVEQRSTTVNIARSGGGKIPPSASGPPGEREAAISHQYHSSLSTLRARGARGTSVSTWLTAGAAAAGCHLLNGGEL
ncbi:hypothetical protein NDU88_004151 [Pleurodeles waltl]|uniref:Uncharacterized protein n=1 Tax=Pleurodeles waltl TaxID=8319 RepID=A0AAV7V259_PLEWA|nr:hypothetical protein NDU88_004151 [Pleurodeles waltl]